MQWRKGLELILKQKQSKRPKMIKLAKLAPIKAAKIIITNE